MRLAAKTHVPRTWVALLISVAVTVGTLVGIAPVEAAAASLQPRASALPLCSTVGVTVTPLHRPAGASYRPFYADFSNNSTLHSNYAGYRIDDTNAFPEANTYIRISGLNGGTAPKIKAATGQSATPSAAVVRSVSTAAGDPTDALAYVYLTATAKSSNDNDPQTFEVEVFNGDPASGGVGVCHIVDGFSKVDDIISAGANKVTGITVTTSRPAVGSTFAATATGNSGTRGAGPSYDQDAGNGVFSMTPSMSDTWPAKVYQLTGLTLSIPSLAATYEDSIRVYPPGSSAVGYSATYKFRVGGTTGSPTLFEPRQDIASGTQVKYTGSYSSTFYLSSPVVSISLSKAVSAVVNGGPGDDTITYTVVATNSGDDTGTISYFKDTLDDSGSVTATYVPGTSTFNGAGISDPTITAGATTLLQWSGSFSVPPKTVSGNGTVSLTYQVRVTGSPGSVKNSVIAGLADDTIGSVTGAPASTTFDDSFPVITTATLPLAPLNQSYTQTVQATGGSGPGPGGTYTNYTVTSGSLPTGLSIDDSGTITGTPTVAGTYTFQVTCKDSAGNTSYPQTLTIVVAAPPPDITTQSVPNGTTGTAYSTTLAAQSGTGSYTWDISAGALPDGLSLNPSTGAITGTPTTAGTYTFTARVTDAQGNTDTQQYTITIADPTPPPPPPPPPAPLAITTSSLAGGTVGTTYYAPLAGAGGTGTYTWGIASGSLPAGLTLDPATGVISGTPTVSETFPVTYRLTDAAGVTTTKTLDITVTAAPLVITTDALPSGTVGTTYSAPLAGTGGTGAYSWGVASGSLPAGLTLDPATGVISGTPTVSGTFPVTYRLTDAAGVTTTKTIPITVTAAPIPLAITTDSLPGGIQGQPYATPIEGTGGVGPYAWELAAGALPAGLTLDPVTGVISGTPTESGTFPITVKLTDADGTVTYKTLTIPVGGPLEITTPSVPEGERGDPYSAPLEGAGGVGPYTWSISGGSLPAGLTLNPVTGVISGTPTVSGDFPITVTLTDKDGVTTTHDYVVALGELAPLVITTDQLPSGMTGDPYVSSLAATGGEGPYNWRITEGTLPPGLTLDPATGVISGTPTAAGTYCFVAAVTDADGVTTEKQFCITTGATAPLEITTTALPGGYVGDAYSMPVEAIGGTGPYTWSIVGGTLPAGLTLDPTTGVVSGTPTQEGTYPITFQVTDAKGVTDIRTLPIVIDGPLAIITNSMPMGETGVRYSAPLEGVGGEGAYTWAIVGGSLPAGLTLDPRTGVVSGTPTQGGEYPITVQLTDAEGRIVTKDLVVPINTRPPLVITTSDLPTGDPGTPYVGSLDAEGGKGPYLWAIVDGALPPGLTLDPLTGAITGTPSEPGAFCFTARVTDVNGQDTEKRLCIPVGEDAPLAITTPSLPAGKVGAPYSSIVEAEGGDGGPYAFALAGGSLPPGLTLDPDGTISGTPTTPGSYAITVQARDGSGGMAYYPYVIVVPDPVKPSIVTPSLPPAEAGTPYSAPLEGAGGTGPYQWEVTSGSLPPGMSLSPDGIVSGSPTAPGTYTFTVTLTDAEGEKVSRDYTIVVVLPGAPVIVNPSVPSTTVGEPYKDHLVGEGGAGGPYTFELVSGQLPPGVALNADGSLRGEPTEPGAYTITVRVYDKYGNSSVRSYVLTIGGPQKRGIRIVQTVSAGNDLRTQALTVSLSCTRPNGTKITQSRSLAAGKLTKAWTVEVPAGTRCAVTETSTGAPEPTRVSPTWDGKSWPGGTRSSATPGLLILGKQAIIGGDKPAARAAVTKPCALDSGTLTAASAGDCTMSWTLPGGAVANRVAWEVERGGRVMDEGKGRTVSSVVTGTRLTTVTLDNAYRRGPSVTKRPVSVVQSACEISADPAASLARGGTSTALNGIAVSAGCTPPKVTVVCSPLVRSLDPRGDYEYCTWVLQGDRLVITTRDIGLQVTVTLTTTPKGASGPKTTWTRSWRT